MSINEQLISLGLASSRARTRLLLKPFLVEAALARLERPLSLDEQKVILRAVADPKQVNWPEWWQAS